MKPDTTCRQRRQRDIQSQSWASQTGTAARSVGDGRTAAWNAASSVPGQLPSPRQAGAPTRAPGFDARAAQRRDRLNESRFDGSSGIRARLSGERVHEDRRAEPCEHMGRSGGARRWSAPSMCSADRHRNSVPRRRR